MTFSIQPSSHYVNNWFHASPCPARFIPLAWPSDVTALPFTTGKAANSPIHCMLNCTEFSWAWSPPAVSPWVGAFHCVFWQQAWFHQWICVVTSRPVRYGEAYVYVFNVVLRVKVENPLSTLTSIHPIPTLARPTTATTTSDTNHRPFRSGVHSVFSVDLPARGS